MQKKPNVLILFSDQQRYDTISAAENDHMITPNLDRLMQEGCYFPNAHSSNPVCMPARHDFITGLTGKHHGYYTNAENMPIKDYNIPTLPRLFAENGYRTAAIGKMHFYPVREHHGFGEMRLMEELPKRREDDQYAMYLKKEGMGEIQNLHGVRPHIYHIPQISQQDLKHHGTSWVADETIQWLVENGEAPFCIMSSFIQPHPPWNIPKEMQGIYDNCRIPEPIGKSRSAHDEQDSEWFGDSETEEEWKNIRKAYYISVTMVDDAIGKILNYLRESGKLEQTIVIFNSDHGEMLKDKGYYSKELPYDSSVRVPLIIRYPQHIKAGTKDERFVDTLDILPTCLDLCDLKYSASYPLVGESLFRKNAGKNRSIQISSTGVGYMRWVMARNQSYKYHYHYNGGLEELYDMTSAEGEVVNLLNNRENLTEELLAVLTSLKDEVWKFEAENAPTENIEDGVPRIFEFQMLHPSVRGKFHFWSNHQMQTFYPKKNRKTKLMEEMKHGIEIEKVFTDTSWWKDLEEGILDYCEK